MNNTIVNLLIALLLFVSAYYTFDWDDWTRIGLSIVLILSGVHYLLLHSESIRRRRLGRTCFRTSAVIAVFLIAKLIIFG